MYVCPNGGHTYMGKECGVCWVMGLEPKTLAENHAKAKTVFQSPDADNENSQHVPMTYYEEKGENV